MKENRFSTLNPQILERWRVAARAEGIPPEASKPQVRIVRDESGRSAYTFGIIRNEHRFKRTGAESPGIQESGSCNLCSAVQSALADTRRNLKPDYPLGDFVVTTNKFPTIEGFSLATTRNERPMFTTQNLKGVAEELEAMLRFAQETGFEIFHNSPGFGATIPYHEHWHLATFRGAYGLAGGKYGLDAAEKESLKGYRGVRIAPIFPFAHLIFDSSDPARLVGFLSKMHDSMSTKYKELSVPHVIAQGYDGLFVAPGKNYLSRSRGSGDMMGHVIVKSQEDFCNMNFESCRAEVDKLLFRREEINLLSYL